MDKKKEFERIKFAIAQIQFDNLHLNADKTAIEANASNHKIATWIDQAIQEAINEWLDERISDRQRALNILWSKESIEKETIKSELTTLVALKEDIKSGYDRYSESNFPPSPTI